MQSAALERHATAADEPIRLLLVRSKPGELPWLAETIRHFLSPAQIVQVIGLGNALWRLGQDRFDTVLLDLDQADDMALQRCRAQIGSICDLPVLDLRDEPEAALDQATATRRAVRPEPVRRPVAEPRQPHRRVARLPWERRAKRQGAPVQAISHG